MKINFCNKTKVEKLSDVEIGKLFKLNSDSVSVYMKTDKVIDMGRYKCVCLGDGFLCNFYNDDVFIFNGVLNEVDG